MNVNLELVLVAGVFLTGVIWGLDTLLLRGRRSPAAAMAGAGGARTTATKDPWYVEYSRSFFPVLLNTYSGVRGVDPVQLQTARTFGVTGNRLLWTIVLPASAPYIFTGLRVSLAVALIVMVISEMVAASSGIGYFILGAQRAFRVREMFAGVITLALVGYALNRLFLLVENRVLAWHYGYTQQQRN